MCRIQLSDGFPARAIEGEVALSCAADAVGLVVRYEEGFGFENGLRALRVRAAAPLRWGSTGGAASTSFLD